MAQIFLANRYVVKKGVVINMHTFFINTSQKKLDKCNILFDIHHEDKSLVSMDCLMSRWYEDKTGYKACVRQIEDMIDGYVEIDNTFNLVVYIDLAEDKVYSAIDRDPFKDRDREDCCNAMHILFTHIISESIVQELANSGRKPQNTLIMFGEEKKFADFPSALPESSRGRVMKKVLDYIGFPANEKIVETAKAVHASDAEDKVAVFAEEFNKICGTEMVLGIRDRYKDSFLLWYDKVIVEADVPRANDFLFDSIFNIYKTEVDRGRIESVSCPYDCLACKDNPQVLTLSRLNVSLYLLKCVEANSIFDPVDGDDRHLIEFHSYTVQEIASVLASQKEKYAKKLADVTSFSESYVKHGLVPELSAFDHVKFGLDEYGEKNYDLVVNDVTPEKANGKKSKTDVVSDKIDKNDNTIVIKGNTKKVSVVQKTGRVLFSEDEYKAFNYNYEVERDPLLKKNATPAQYIDRAKEVRRHHLDYLKKLQAHVTNVLSNYAGESKDNSKPALLRMGEYRYATPEKETRALNAVEESSEKAYENIVEQYMNFCEGRSVAITDIEEQCNWFVSRIAQIEESLKKIKIIAIGLLISVIVLYIPFVVIQFEAITQNIFTLLTALGSIAVPIVLLFLILVTISALQKRRYLEAWKIFEKKSNQALEENRIAVQKYDQLLSVVIPALRWVYEYKLDVGYCSECCEIANAKIGHHKQKLNERVRSLQDLLSALDFNASKTKKTQNESETSEDEIDFNVAFCSGETNRSFYTVIKGDALDRKGN